jgi:hypothetical protein
MSDGEPYGGALGAFPYAVRTSESWVFRAYGAVAAFAAGLFVFVFVLSLVGIVASTANQSASITLVRAFVLLLLVFVLVPTVAPVLLVARRHRLDRPVDPRYDGALAAAGFTYLTALYVGLVASVPADMREPPTGTFAPVVDVLYELPQVGGVVPPLLAALGIWLLHRRLREETRRTE